MRNFFLSPVESTLAGFGNLILRVIVTAIVIVAVLWILGLILTLVSTLAGVAVALPHLLVALIWVAFAVWVVVLFALFVIGLI